MTPPTVAGGRVHARESVRPGRPGRPPSPFRRGRRRGLSPTTVSPSIPIPLSVDGIEPLVVGFTKAERRPAGRAGLHRLRSTASSTSPVRRIPSGTPLRLVAFPDAPTVAEDGFEVRHSQPVGGAMVMTAGPLPAIAGNTSLYIGGMGAPALDAPNGRSLMVRSARQAGRYEAALLVPGGVDPDAGRTSPGRCGGDRRAHRRVRPCTRSATGRPSGRS